MIAEFFMMTVGAIAIVSIPIVWLSAVDEEIKLRRESADDEEKAKKESTIFESFETFVLNCDQDVTVYVSPEIWIQCRKNDVLDFIPSFEDDGIISYYCGRVIVEDKNELMFRAEKEL